MSLGCHFPGLLAEAFSMRSINEIEARSLAMHRLIVDKIRKDPALFQKVRATLARWRQIVCLSSQPYLEEWECLMNQGMEAALSMALDESQHAADLRRSSPFSGVLTNRERFIFLRDWKEQTQSM